MLNFTIVRDGQPRSLQWTTDTVAAIAAAVEDELGIVGWSMADGHVFKHTYELTRNGEIVLTILAGDVLHCWYDR